MKPPDTPGKADGQGISATIERFAAARMARKVEREASKLVFSDGSSIYKDSPPGVGWVLKRPKKVKLYFEFRESAIARAEKEGLILA